MPCWGAKWGSEGYTYASLHSTKEMSACSCLWLPSNLSFCCCVSVHPQITMQQCLVLEELWDSLLIWNIIHGIALLLAYLRQELFFPSWCSGWPIYANLFPHLILMSEIWINLVMLKWLVNIMGQTWPLMYILHWPVEELWEGVPQIVETRVLKLQAQQAVYMCAHIRLCAEGAKISQFTVTAIRNYDDLIHWVLCSPTCMCP